MREWPCECTVCEFSGKVLGWDHQLPLPCPSCGAATRLFDNRKVSHGIVPDDIPGGMDIEHAICHPDGTPKRYYSRTEIKRALNKAGYVINGDSPKPYRVSDR